MQADIRDYGARPGAETLNTSAIQSTIEAVAASGGRVVVPAGVWRTGTIRLRSHVELYLCRGATLLGTNNPDDYPAESPVDTGAVVSRRAFDRRMIYGCEVEDVGVVGAGTIDGAGGCAGHTFERGNEGRPANLQFVACRGVTVRDVHLRCAGSWMQQYLACEDVHLHGRRVWNHDNRTNDGMDIDGCADVRVSDCDIDSRDDALVFKSTGPNPCRNIVVTGCRLRSNCHGIKFGTESVGGFENIRVSDCIISPSRHAEPMPGYPDGRPVITGCALECVDGGSMRQISLSGLVMEKVFAPVFVKLGCRHDRRIPDEEFTGHGVLEDVQISQVIARDAGPYTCSITGYPGHPVRRVQLSDIRMLHRGGVAEADVLADVPENEAGYPEINMFLKGPGQGKQLPAWGFFLRHVEDVSLVNVRADLMAADVRRPVVARDVTNLSMVGTVFEGLCDEECVSD